MIHLNVLGVQRDLLRLGLVLQLRFQRFVLQNQLILGYLIVHALLVQLPLPRLHFLDFDLQLLSLLLMSLNHLFDEAL